MSVINKRRLTVKKIIKTAVLIAAVIAVFIVGLTVRIAVADSYVYTDIASLETALGNANAAGITVDNGKIATIQFNDSEIACNSLIILSNATPALYADCLIRFNEAQVDLTGTYNTMTYKGLGGEGAPFCGTLQRSQMGEEIFVPKISRALFNLIDIKADLPADLRLNIASGSVIQSPVFAENVTCSTQTSASWSFTLTSQANAEITTGGLLGTVGEDIDNLTVGLSFSGISRYNVNVVGGNAGCICNTLGANSKITVDEFLPAVVMRVSGVHAGAVVGSIGENAELDLNDFSPSGAITVTSSADNAGGVAGLLSGGSKLTVTDFSPNSLTVSGNNASAVAGSIANNAVLIIDNFSPIGKIAITGTAGAGSVAGEGNGATVRLLNGWSIPVGSDITVTGGFAGGLFGQFTDGKLEVISGIIYLDGKTVVQGSNVGGVFGKLSLSASFSISSLQYNASNRVALKNNVNNAESLGGVVGRLEIVDEDVVFSVIGTSEANKLNVYANVNFWSNLSNSAGGVIGYAYSTESDNKNAKVLVQNVETDISVTGSEPLYNGGIIGKLGNTTNGIYAFLGGCSVTTNKPTGKSYGFGGAVSYQSGNTVLKVEDFTLNTSGQLLSGAGVVSRVNGNDVVCLSGTIDLSRVTHGSNSLGQLIGVQRNSLVYAENGISLSRGTGSVVVNDIGNYGSIIRLGGNPKLSADLFTINDDYNRVKLKSGAMYAYASNVATVANTDQFVVLTCSIQNNFFLPYGVSAQDNYENKTLLRANISITADVDLTGTGVFSLMRDVWESNDTGYNFSGTIDGNNNTVTLDTGTPWGTGGVVGSIDGSIIGIDRYNGNGNDAETHSNLGLLRSIKGGSVVIRNLHFTGAYKYTSKRGWTKAGVLIAYGDQNLTISNVSIAVNTTMVVDGGNNPNEFGIMVGSCLNSSSGVLTITDCTVDGTINVSRSGATLRFGCVTGIVYGSGYKTVNITNTAILANVTFNGNIEAALTIGKIENGGKTVRLDRLSFGSAEKEASLATTNFWNRTGCLLGCNWIADVEFNSTVAGQYGLDAKNISITASNGEIGGLCGTALGWWKVFENGIRLDDFNLNRGYGGTTGTGLLIYYGAVQSAGALYLELQSSNSYVITANTSVESGNHSNFDELVCWLYDNDMEFVNGQSIISIETEGSAPIDTAATPNTYVNRTKNSRNNANTAWNPNPNARYYYNLYTIKSKGSRTKGEDLLIWSVFQYANSKIRQCCTNKTWDNNMVLDCGSQTQFDLRGLSYYPVDTSGINVRNAIIIFDNDSIETAENHISKTTKMLTKQLSQHYMMHSGLFYNASGNVTVNNLTFRGNVAYSSDISGALICKSFVSGTNENKKTLSITDLKLDGICLNGYTGNGYAPLLINKIGEYVTLTMQTVYTVNVGVLNSYENTGIDDNWYAASSLIGDIGFYDAGSDTGAKGITLSFSDIRLDGRETETADGKIASYGTYRSIFSRSTLINSFMYKEGCSGTYNFTKEEDWDGNDHIRHVTYGEEISESTKNSGEQLHYYDSKFFVNANSAPNEVTANIFTAFLKYVYSTGTGSYEIDVNLTIYVFVDGCGTYGDPYVITEGGQIEGLEYFLLNDKPKNGVIICYYSGNTDTVHISADDSDHRYYRYNSNAQSWEVSDTSDGSEWESNDILTSQLLEHMRTAYYYIDNDISLGGLFGGIGTENNPFSGVIVGNGSDTPTVTIEGSQAEVSAPKTSAANGLVNVAKGCVVKNVHIVYENDVTVTVANEAAPSIYSLADYFGGVIGYVVGGDNVIDGVSVSLPIISVTLGVNNNYLCSVGGMVGVINNGGVVFRGTNTVTGLDARFNATSYATIYFNPYVGRALDGYAFADVGSTVNNNDKQYKIPTLASGQIIVSGQTVTVTSPQDLFVLSILINSGAIGSNDATKPTGYDSKSRYRGRATYNNVKPASVAEAVADYLNARKDNTGSDGSYLFTLVNGTLNGTNTYSVNFDSNISFVGSSFDGTTFRGIGSRYGDALQNLTVSNTQNRILDLDMLSREYSNDNFVSRGVGFINQLGSFSNVNVNLTVEGSVEALNYNAGGALAAIGFSPVVVGGDAGREAGVGAFVGYISTAAEITIKGVTLGNGLSVSGSYCVGGLVGMKVGTGVLNVQDCLVNGISVRSDTYAGGLIGLSLGTVNVKMTANSATFSSISVEPNDTNRVRNYAAFGGFAGYAKDLNVGENGKTLNVNTVYVENRSTQPNVCIGGLVGNSDKTADIKNVSVTGITVNGRENIAQSGGLIGKISGSSTSVTVDNVNIDIGNSGYIYGKYAGGYIGNFDQAEADVVLKDSSISGSMIRGNSAVGGIIGYVANNAKSVSISNTSVNVADIRLANGLSVGHVGGVIGLLGQAGEAVIENVKIAEEHSVYIIGRASISQEGSNSAGGIVGSAAPRSMTISDTAIGYAYSVVIESGEDVGGVIGYVSSDGITVEGVIIAQNGDVTVEAVSENASIHGNAGGVIGQVDNSVTVNDVQIANAEAVTVLADDGFSGGAVGCVNGGTVTVSGFNVGDYQNNAVYLTVGMLTDGDDTVYSATSGGLFGMINTTADDGTLINGAIIYNAEIYAKNAAGGVIGIEARSFSIKNSALEGVTVNGSITGSGWTSSSAFVGRLTEGATADGYNILLKDVSVADSQAEPQQGLWVGSVDSASCSVKLIGVSAVNVEPLSIDDVNGNCDVSYIIYADFDGDGTPVDNDGDVKVSESPENSTVIGLASNEITLFGNGAAVKTTGEGTVSFPAYILGQTGRRGYATDLTGDNMSTFRRFHAENINDFSVFLIMDTESITLTETILNYADFITGGGAKKYFNIVSDCISVDTYEYVDGRFLIKETATLTYNAGSFSLNGIDSRDSDKEQFTLVTFSFSNDSVSGYKLYVPIIITKPVEVVIDVGISQGSVFRDNLVNKDTAIIEYGKRATIRVNYKYFYDNWDTSDLNWSYVKDISLTNIIDNIPESMMLPTGTYITLIDAQSNDAAYSYVVTGNSISKIVASSFEGWIPQSMGTLLKAELAADVNDEYALWVMDNISPSIIIDGNGYRKKTEEDEGDVYVIACEETYFVVIELPDNESVDVQYRSIEFLFDNQLSGGFANVVETTQTSRKLKIYKDTVQQFSITSESLNGADAAVIENGENEIVLELNSVLELDQNVVTPTTKRYMQFNVGLKYFNSIAYGYRGSVKLTPTFEIIAEGAEPIEVQGSVINMNYNGQKQITVPVNDNGTVIELATYTNMGQRRVTVRTVLTFEFARQSSQSMFPTATLTNGIPVSYVSFDPTMIISDNEFFSSGSRQKASNSDIVEKYYRGSQLDSLLELVADPFQLAINPGATAEPENGNAVIDAIGSMNMVGYEDELDGVDSMTVTICLYQKDNSGEYQLIDATDDALRFLNSVKIGGIECLDDGCTRTVSKGVDNSYGGLFENDVFIIPLKLEVKRKPLLDEVGIMYANYKVEMKVEFYSDSILSAGSTDYFIYTLAKIAEDF